jgi:hypothetical protein
MGFEDGSHKYGCTATPGACFDEIACHIVF